MLNVQKPNYLIEFKSGIILREHLTDEAKAIGDHVEGQTMRLVDEVRYQIQVERLLQITGFDQIKRVVDQRSPVDHIDAFIVAFQLTYEQIPIVQVVIDPIVAGMFNISDDPILGQIVQIRYVYGDFAFVRLKPIDHGLERKVRV